jgi:hypothetical protein
MTDQLYRSRRVPESRGYFPRLWICSDKATSDVSNVAGLLYMSPRTVSLADLGVNLSANPNPPGCSRILCQTVVVGERSQSIHRRIETDDNVCRKPTIIHQNVSSVQHYESETTRRTKTRQRTNSISLVLNVYDIRKTLTLSLDLVRCSFLSSRFC